MVPDVVVDVGNSRVKWGRCRGGVITDLVALPDDRDAWASQLAEWEIPPESRWLLSGSHPERRDRLAVWLIEQSMRVDVLTQSSQLPIDVKVGWPDRVGVDRLLNGIGAKLHMKAGYAAIVVDAGTAITVDLFDSDGAYIGGAILPGLRLMAKALHEHTAKLPLVDLREIAAPRPGSDTRECIAVGIGATVVGGIRNLVMHFASQFPQPTLLFVTGGDAESLAPHFDAVVYGSLTLEGVLVSAEGIA